MINDSPYIKCIQFVLDKKKSIVFSDLG